MISRKFTLNTKDCNYISRNHKTIHTNDFVVFAINQYANRKYDQHSIQLSAKLAKSSVYRHLVKRHFMHGIEEYIYSERAKIAEIYGKYLRIPKKETIEKLAPIWANKDKIFVKNEIKKMLESNIQQFCKKRN